MSKNNVLKRTNSATSEVQNEWTPMASETMMVAAVAAKSCEPVTGVAISRTSLLMKVNSTHLLTAQVYPEDAANPAVTWKSSNTNIATVSKSGLVCAQSIGSATITVRTNDGGYTKTCAVTVGAPVSGVELSKTALTMSVNSTHLLGATVVPSNAVNKAVTWSSSNTNVATVSSGGLVCAKAAGSTTITVKTKDGGFTKKCLVTVGIPVTGVEISKTSLSMNVNSTYLLNATVAPSNAANKAVTWSSSNTNVATVSSGGLVCAKAAGSTMIAVKTKDGGFTKKCSVTVSVPVTGVEITNIPSDLRVNNSYQLSANVKPLNATNREVVWSSSHTDIATIHQSSGLLCTKSAGQTTITVKTKDGGKIAAFIATIAENDVPPLQKPHFPLPAYPTGLEAGPKPQLDICDPKEYIRNNEYGIPSVKDLDNWYLTVNFGSDEHYVAFGTHPFIENPVEGQTVNETWYYLNSRENDNRLYIASKADSYRAIAYCDVEIYDKNFVLLGRAGDIIKIKGGEKYYIRAYGIGPYYLYISIMEYLTISNHFALDSKLHKYLTRNIISAENFNNYMERLDLLYDTMLDLVGKAPCNGERITIKQGSDPGSSQYTHPGTPYIYYALNVVEIFRTLETETENWWLAGSTHELGHLFDEDTDDKWLFTIEGMATYKAWLAIEQCNGMTYEPKNPYSEEREYVKPLRYHWNRNLQGHIEGSYSTDSENPYKYHIFLDNGPYEERFWRFGDDIVFLLSPIFELGWDNSWKIFKSVFRSYYDSYYNQLYDVNSYPGIFPAQKKVASFLDRCSHFMSQYVGCTVDIQDYWLEATRKRYLENISAWIRLEPQAPRIGDSLTYSVFNNPALGMHEIRLQSDSDEPMSFKETSVSIPEKCSFHHSVGYRVTENDLGKSFALTLSGMPPSNWTKPVTR